MYVKNLCNILVAMILMIGLVFSPIFLWSFLTEYYIISILLYFPVFLTLITILMVEFRELRYHVAVYIQMENTESIEYEENNVEWTEESVCHHCTLGIQEYSTWYNLWYLLIKSMLIISTYFLEHYLESHALVYFTLYITILLIIIGTIIIDVIILYHHLKTRKWGIKLATWLSKIRKN